MPISIQTVYNRRWRAKNAERVKLYNKEYRLKHKARINKLRAIRRKRDRESLRVGLQLARPRWKKNH